MRIQLKNLEIIFLILIHIFYALFIMLMPLVFFLCYYITTNSFDVDFLFDEKPALLLFCVVWFILVCIKFASLPLIYKQKKLFPAMHMILNKIMSDKSYARKYLILVAVIDILPFVFIGLLDTIILKDFVKCMLANLLSYPISVLLGGGILPCYLVLLLCSKNIKKKISKMHNFIYIATTIISIYIWTTGKGYLFLPFVILVCVLYFFYCLTMIFYCICKKNSDTMPLLPYIVLTILLIFQCFTQLGMNMLRLLPWILLPVVVALILKWVFAKIKLNKIFSNIFMAICGILAVIYFLIFSLIAAYMPSAKLVPRFLYVPEIQRLKKENAGYSVFPSRVPRKIKKYRFEQESAFDGYNTNYLRFQTNKEYVDKIRQEYKNRCQEITTNRELLDNYQNVYITGLDSEQICITHKNTEQEPYTSGIVFGEDTVYFFFSNY